MTQQLPTGYQQLMNHARFPFSGMDTVHTSYSQAFQDLFVLSMLNGQRNGSYLEVGANLPITCNNTFLLERDFGWRGVSLEFDPQFVEPWKTQRPNGCLLVADALTIDYAKALPIWFGKGTTRIDYLQLDIDPSINTLNVLKRLPLDDFRVSVITFETDAYLGDYKARDESRELLNKYGYQLVAPDIHIVFSPVSSDPIPFEDWWVDPLVVDASKVATLKQLRMAPLMPEHVLFE